MTALEQYIEDMRKNMSSNQLEMKEYFIQLAKALDADLKGKKEPDNSYIQGVLPDTALKTVCELLELNHEIIYADIHGALRIQKISEPPSSKGHYKYPSLGVK